MGGVGTVGTHQGGGSGRTQGVGIEAAGPVVALPTAHQDTDQSEVAWAARTASNRKVRVGCLFLALPISAQLPADPAVGQRQGQVVGLPEEARQVHRNVSPLLKPSRRIRQSRDLSAAVARRQPR